MATLLHEERIEAVMRALLASGARSVLDLGCGPGVLLARLAREPQLERIVGLDVSAEALAAAAQALGKARGRVTLLHGSFARPDPRLAGFDAAALVETIEHINPDRLSSVERAVFGSFRPRTVVVTTPNLEYNVLYGLPDGRLRHRDHRFEWSRAKLEAWAGGVAGRNGYRVAFAAIGDPHPTLGGSTQMATFRRCAEEGIP
jgi:small RNA 2'-O-methyltransferase